MLSEVLREREFQTKHVARKAELLKMQEERFLQQQREVRYQMKLAYQRVIELTADLTKLAYQREIRAHS